MMKRIREGCWHGVFFGILVLTLSHSCYGLIISEVMYHPADESLEFIELYNDRAVFEDLGGCAFTDGVHYVFAPDTILPGKSYLVIAADPNAVETAYGISGVLGPYEGKLSNSGESIILSNENGGIVLSLDYDVNPPWPSAPDGTGHSLTCIQQGGDPEEASTWAASTYLGGTPGTADQSISKPEDPTILDLVDIGTTGLYFKGIAEPSPGPGGQATTAWTQIGYNDDPIRTAWQTGPAGYGYSNNPAELEPVRTLLNDMAGNYISIYVRLPFNLTAEHIDSLTQLSAQVWYDDAYILYLNGTRVAASEQFTQDPPAFDQAAASANDYTPVVIDLTGYLDLLVPGTNILALQVHNASIGGSSDCIAAAVLKGTLASSPFEDTPAHRLVINEVLSNSDAAPGRDWIELYNPGPQAVSLGPLYLSDQPNDLLKFKLPQAVVLLPGEFYEVHQGTEDSVGFNFDLDFRGETVYLTAATSENPPTPMRVLDAFRFDASEPEVTIGRYPDGSTKLKYLATPTPGASNSRERLDAVVINEIMYHPLSNDDTLEYVELYNRSHQVVSLDGWAFTDGIDYTFDAAALLEPGQFAVIAADPNRLEPIYPHLVKGQNLFGPYNGQLNDHNERIRLSRPIRQLDPDSGYIQTFYLTADEVTYYDGGAWPTWADGRGSSMELIDPDFDNDTPGAWADSDESNKTSWQPFSYTISDADRTYTHDRVTLFDMMLLNQGEILLDDLECVINDSQVLVNGGFESGTSGWRILGNHVQSHVIQFDAFSGTQSLYLVATGHGDPGANRINRSINSTTAGEVTFRGRARWLRGSPFLLLRTTRELAPVQPPRPSRAFELTVPPDLGTPGLPNTAETLLRGPDITEVKHEPVIPQAGERIIVTAHVASRADIQSVVLNYRSEGNSDESVDMVDDGTGDDVVAGDGLYTAAIPGAGTGTMRAFTINATDGLSTTQFPKPLAPSADVPERTCLVRVGDTSVNTELATYRVWMSDDVVNTFRSRSNLSNELLDCTFVYNNAEVFYNARIRFRGSPWLRGGSGRDPRDRYAFRVEFNPEQRFHGRDEINLDNTEGGSRGPLQERASYWFYRKMGLQYSRQEFIRLILNGRSYGSYEDVQKIDGDYIDKWFPNDNNGYLHKIDDYFEFNAAGTQHSNLDEGLKYDGRHPLIPETYRWGFEKRSHHENDNWSHLFLLAQNLNTSSVLQSYESRVESALHPEHFVTVLALRHMVGDWDSYGYRRGKNNQFYYAPIENKWYLLPWDIDFTLGSGDGPNTNLPPTDGGLFPEVDQFLRYPKYADLYVRQLWEIIHGPWQTSVDTTDPPTAFDRFIDDSAAVLIADGQGSGRRDQIKQYVRNRRNYVLNQVVGIAFRITTNDGRDFCIDHAMVTLEGTAPLDVASLQINGDPWPAAFTGNRFEVEVPLVVGTNKFVLRGLDADGQEVSGAITEIVISRGCR